MTKLVIRDIILPTEEDRLKMTSGEREKYNDQIYKNRLIAQQDRIAALGLSGKKERNWEEWYAKKYYYK